MEKNFDMSQQQSYICKYLNDLVEHLNNRTESLLMPLVTSVRSLLWRSWNVCFKQKRLMCINIIHITT